MSLWPTKNWTQADLRMFRMEHQRSRMYVCTHLKCYERAAMVDAMFGEIDTLETVIEARQDEQDLLRCKLAELHKAMSLDSKDFQSKELEAYATELAKILGTKSET